MRSSKIAATGLALGVFLTGCMNEPEQGRVDASPTPAEHENVLGVITQPPQPDDTLRIEPDSARLPEMALASYPPAGLPKVASGTPYIILYAAKDYGGAQFVIHSPRDWSTLTTTPAGNWNDVVSSIRFFNGAQAHFWAARDFAGGGYTLNSDIPNLTSLGFNDVISSVSWVLPSAVTSNAYFRMGTAYGSPGTVMNLYYPLDYNQLPPAINNQVSWIQLIINSSYPYPTGNIFFNDNWGGQRDYFYVDEFGRGDWVPLSASRNDQYSSLYWD